MIPVGLAYFAIYYGLFHFVIVRFDLKTPGRESDPETISSLPIAGHAGGRAADFIAALGGPSNLLSIDACTTRLRLIIADSARIDEVRLKALGARGFVRPSDRALQIVLGPIADQVAGEIRSALRETAAVSVGAPELDAGDLLSAIGGRSNVRSIEARSSRLLLTVTDEGAVDGESLKALGLRGLAKLGMGRVHLIVGPQAEKTGLRLQHLTSAS